MNDQKGNREFKAFYEVYQKLAKGGVQNLYKGFAVSSVGTFIYRGIFFFVQENSLTPTLSEFEILNDSTLIIHNSSVKIRNYDSC